MKICFVISDLKTETCGTSVVILKKAHERGHKVYRDECWQTLFSLMRRHQSAL